MSGKRRGSRVRIAAIVVGVLVAATLIGVGVAESSTSGGDSSASGKSPTSSPTAHPPASTSSAPSPALVADHPAAKAGAKPCTTVTVLASLENADMVRHLASAYAMSPRNVDGHCVHVTVTSQMSGLAEHDVHDGFMGMSGMSRPDVWLPDSSAWLELARPSGVVPSSAPSIGQAAIVLAMPVELASALHWVSEPPTWAQIFSAAENPNVFKQAGHPGWGSFKIGKATPELATSGLLSLAGAYRAADGNPATLTPADVDKSSVQQHVAASELPTAHYMSAPAEFLFHAREADQTGSLSSYLSAMFMDETTVWDYNRGVIPTPEQMGMVGTGGMSMTGMGGASGGGMNSGSGGGMKHGAGGKLAPPHEKLVPIYPRDGVYVADNPAAILHGSWVSAAQHAAAADFIRYARSVQGQAVVRASGYRDIRGDLDPQISKVTFAESNIKALPLPDPAALRAVQQSFPTVRKRARVLFLLDVSGSMSYVIHDRTTKLAAAKQAIADSLSYFDPDDRVGLAAFSNRPRGRITPGLVSPIKTLRSGKSAFLAALHRLHPISETPLYSAVDQFVERLAGSYDPNAINAVVVLSDGHNNTSHRGSRSQMLDMLARVHMHVPILVFTLGYGHQADTSTLEAISSATGAHYFNATNPDTIKEILADELVTSF